jgi:hypothetical protein
MAYAETYIDKSSPSNSIPPQFAAMRNAMGKMGFETVVGGQTELLEDFQRLSRNWLDRMQSEAAFASEFAAKLMATRSIPESATVWQELASRRMEKATEDTKRFLANGQKFAEAGARWLSSGSTLSGRGRIS